MSSTSRLRPPILLAIALLSSAAIAHDHGTDNIDEGETISKEPIDTTLWLHILLQMLSFGIMFPVGMVLGMVKSRWHVPLQVASTVIAVLAYFLGHMHKGRQFLPSNVHSSFANWLYILLVAQVVLGVYLKLHLEKGFQGRIRPIFRMAHSINGKLFPVLSWTQMIFGGITALGFCQGDHLGQCAAHFIMGSAFIAYGTLLSIALVVGQAWIRRTGRSQEFYDSCVIAIWGCINTFTEHRWGTAWVKNDWQHTTMGIIWWCAGLAGIWLSRGRDGSPKRNFVPGFVLLITGWGMSAHPQDLKVSAMTHAMFGYTLMAAGLTRMIEVAFILQDKSGMTEDGTESHSFQYIPIFLLYASGYLFLGATEEQMNLVAHSGLDHVSYILILYSLAFLTFLFTNMLIGLYDRSANEELLAKKSARRKMNGHAHRRTESHQVRDAEEFELHGLMTDDEDNDDEEQQQQSRGLLGKEGQRGGHEEGIAIASSPSTVGSNHVRIAS